MTAPLYNSGLSSSLAHDYQVVDGVQTVTYTTANASTAVLTFADFHEFTADEREVLSGLFQAGDRRWYLPGDQLAAAAISPSDGDRITDANGVVWTFTGPCVLDDFGISWLVPTTKAR